MDGGMTRRGIKGKRRGGAIGWGFQVMLIPLIYLISGWRWSLFTSDVPLLGKTDERTGEREREVKMKEYQKENKRDRGGEWLRFPGLVVGCLERSAATPLSAVMRSVVDGPLIFLLAPPFPPVSWARGTKAEPSPCSGRLIQYLIGWIMFGSATVSYSRAVNAYRLRKQGCP